MKNRSSTVMLMIFSYLIILLIPNNEPILFYTVIAGSQAFSNQEINTGYHIGIEVNGIAHTQTKPHYTGPLDNSVEWEGRF